ncbi:heme oxygenase [Lambiella insularis]|nr:heme oxygenase [Lambiella insularis]
MADSLPASSRSRSVLVTSDPLPKRIAAATRSAHTHLNHLLVARLPLALPPSAHSSEIYAIGLQRFAPVYLAFEAAWSEIVDLQPLEASQATDHRIFSALKHLYMPELMRTQSLRNDLSCLMQQSLVEVDDQLERLGGQQLHLFLERFDQVCARKPHILLAYAWVMYMALFNGGRWIRAQLLEARNSSWNLSPDAASRGTLTVDQTQGLMFWHFPGVEDGEDLKNEFKARLNDIEDLLDDEQKKDIIEEARSIFKHCTLLVGELDEIVAARPPQPHTLSSTWSNSWMKHLLPLGIADVVHALLLWMGTSRWYAWIVKHGQHHDDAKNTDRMQ